MRWGLLFLGVCLFALSTVSAQTPVSGLFFTESWDSGSVTATFNSRYYGNLSGSQFRLQTAIRRDGAYALEHQLPAGTSASAIQYATQHFADAVTGPVHAVGQGQHMMDFYIQFRIYYSPNFDLTGKPKQFIIGTQDDQRHDATCCNPWVSHYLMFYPPHPAFSGGWVAEANAKQATSGQFYPLYQNRNGYSGTNIFTTQTGRWYTVEVRRKLNDPGVRNGIFQMWIDHVLISEYTDVRYRVPFDGTFGSNMIYGTNFALISDYMSSGSSQTQSIFYDDVRFSTTRIGPPLTTGAPTMPTRFRILSNPT